jgi:hypothetical protein
MTEEFEGLLVILQLTFNLLLYLHLPPPILPSPHTERVAAVENRVGGRVGQVEGAGGIQGKGGRSGRWVGGRVVPLRVWL